MYNEENADVYAFMGSFKELHCSWGGTICI